MDADDERQEVALLLRRLTVELDAVGQRFASMHALGRTDVRALVAIMDAARRGSALTAGALGSAVELSSASVTALVDRLERAGHVHRVRDPEDRRRVVLEMYDAAMAAGAAFFGGMQRDLVSAMRSFTDDELAVVRRFLTEMTDVIVRHAHPRGCSPRRARSSSTIRRVTGTSTPCRSAARSTAPPIASSSVGCTAAASRCMDDVMPAGTSWVNRQTTSAFARAPSARATAATSSMTARSSSPRSSRTSPSGAAIDVVSSATGARKQTLSQSSPASSSRTVTSSPASVRAVASSSAPEVSWTAARSPSCRISPGAVRLATTRIAPATTCAAG